MEDLGATSETKGNNYYDVFLSFKGEDTRHTFTGYLYDALCRKGISTFIDNESLRIGETIGPQLLKAIQESKTSIIIFSENYAESSWCLDELVQILECQQKKNQLVFPIFYKVEPSDVRHQKNSYGKCMAVHEDRYGHDSEKVQKWRSALFRGSTLSGLHLKQGYEFKFIQDIVSKVTTRVSPKQLHIEEDVVGLQFRVAELKSRLDIESSNSTFMLGIFGTAGIGKTTLAKALYNSICDKFEGACFLSNVRKASSQDMGRVWLQQMLLSEMLEEGKIEFGSVEKGISTIKHRLGAKRVLLVLDDVNKIEQLQELAGRCDWFGSGSRIIITTRDKYLLVSHQVKDKDIYEMQMLNKRESLELFCLNAFKRSCPATDYEELCNRAVCYAKGLPLALKVIASNLIEKDLDEWKSALDKYEKNLHRDILSILRISYDSLDSNEKDIFLDIACFFNGKRLEYVKRILNGCEFHTEDGIRILVDKSLITVEDGYLRMHDLIQDMGREIVKQEAPKDASERSRLWFHKDVIDVLSENIGGRKIEGIKLDCCKEVDFDTTFEKMKKLRILIVRNPRISSTPIHLPNQLKLLDWRGYPSKSFPAGLYHEKIAAFNLQCSHLELEKPFQKFEQLTYMNFSNCQSITQFPDVSGAQNLRELILNRCKKLVKVDESVGFLPKLVYLSASACTQLRSFLSKIYLPSLEYLSFDMCRRLEHIPDVEGKMDKPLKISMKNTAVKELPHSFPNLGGLYCLDMTSCNKLQNLPSSLFMLPNVVTLKIGGCSQLREPLTSFKRCFTIAECRPKLGTLHFSNACLSDEHLHIIVQSFPNLKDLHVSSNYFVSVPTCIKESSFLTSLDVSYCLALQEIQELPSSVQKVDARHCNSLTANTSSMLWSQVQKEINRLEIVMPKTDIPDWFNYYGEGGSPIFWARGKFPVAALAFVFEKVNCQAIGLHLFIDSEHIHVQRQQRHIFNVAEDHVLLCDLGVLFSDEEWKRLDARVGHDKDWKCVQVTCESDLILRRWGVYLYEKGTNIDDIKFMCPYSESSSGMRSVFVGTNTIPMSRDDELEQGSATGSSSIPEEEAPCLEHVKVLNDPNPHSGTCTPFCSQVLSTFKKLLCCKVRGRVQASSPLAQASSPLTSLPLLKQSGLRPPEWLSGTRLEEENQSSKYYFVDQCCDTGSASSEVEFQISQDEDVEDGDVGIGKEATASFSESLQTVVENLKKMVMVIEDHGDDYHLDWLEKTEILSSDDDDDYY